MFNKLNGLETILENLIVFLLAYIFGIISPKSKIKNVASITSTVNFNHSCSIPEKRNSPIKANNITMPTFIKLLAIRIVARSFLGLSNSLSINLKLLGSFFLPFSISDFDNENKATSAPEIIPEKSISIQNPIKPKIKLVLMSRKTSCKRKGSDFKF